MKHHNAQIDGSPRSLLSISRYNFYTIWLFTYSDLKTIVFPSAAFGVINTLAISIQETNSTLTSAMLCFNQTPAVLLWIWINLLPLDIGNQIVGGSIQEDRLNKPWRPLPAGRISTQTATQLMLITYLLDLVISNLLGNLFQSLALIVLGFCYNKLGGANAGFIARNMLNACGFICFMSGSLKVLLPKQDLTLDWWYGTIGCIIFTTVHTQDMYDQRGDAVRKRKTIPLVFGDGPSRWSIAVAVVCWSCLAPWLWHSSVWGYVAPVVLGLTVSGRSIFLRTEGSDKNTFLLWNFWMVSLYMLPLLKALA